jgi:hypothetical protein
MKDTRAERVTDTIVFHHRRITNPTVSMADTVTKVAHDLTTAIQENMHKQVENVEIKELERLASIFQEATQKVAEGDARTPRVPTKHATSPRVPNALNQELERTDVPTPRVDSAEASRYNTRQQKRTYGMPLTDAMLTVMELAGITACPRKLSQHKFSSQVLLEMVNAVMDLETGDMMEYRHLLKNPKYQDTWSKAFGK